MPPPSSNDTGTALGQRGSDWSHDLATLTFDLGGHGACGWCRSLSSVCIPSLKFVGIAVQMIWRTRCVSINGPGDTTLTFDRLTLKLVCESHLRRGTFLPNLGTLGFWVLELFAMYAKDARTDRQTDGGRTDKSNAYCPLPTGAGHTNSQLQHSLLILYTQ